LIENSSNNYDSYTLDELENEVRRLENQQKQQQINKIKKSLRYQRLKRAVDQRVRQLKRGY